MTDTDLAPDGTDARERRSATTGPDGAGRTDGRASDTRGALLDAARGLFAERGYHGASVRAITERAGTALGAITYHFGSKRDLYGAVLAAEIEPLRRRVFEIVGGDGPALERMVAVVDAYFRVLAARPWLPRLMMQEVASGRRPPAAAVEALRAIAGGLGRLQAEGVAEGSTRPADPALTALSLVAQPVYMTLVAPLAAEVLGRPLTDGEALEATVDHATAFVRSGLAVRPAADGPAPGASGDPTHPPGSLGSHGEEER